MELHFDDNTLEAVAALAIERNSGARGLRAIMESLMLPLMYDTPSRNDIAGLLITPDCVTEKAEPRYLKKEVINLDANSISGELN